MTGNLEPRRDFTDVRDVVRAYWLALERGEPGVYNVCSGVATSIARYPRGPRRRTRRWRSSSAPTRDACATARGDGDPGSHDKLTEATGWEPEIPLDQTLRDTLDWWRERVAARVTS